MLLVSFLVIIRYHTSQPPNPTIIGSSTSPPSNGTENKLSPGQIAGIVCGAVTAAAAVAGLIFKFWHRKKPDNTENNTQLVHIHGAPVQRPWVGLPPSALNGVNNMTYERQSTTNLLGTVKTTERFTLGRGGSPVGNGSVSRRVTEVD
jgi:hypothetical protein